MIRESGLYSLRWKTVEEALTMLELPTNCKPISHLANVYIIGEKLLRTLEKMQKDSRKGTTTKK